MVLQRLLTLPSLRQFVSEQCAIGLRLAAPLLVLPSLRHGSRDGKIERRWQEDVQPPPAARQLCAAFPIPPGSFDGVVVRGVRSCRGGSKAGSGWAAAAAGCLGTGCNRPSTRRSCIPRGTLTPRTPCPREFDRGGPPRRPASALVDSVSPLFAFDPPSGPWEIRTAAGHQP